MRLRLMGTRGGGGVGRFARRHLRIWGEGDHPPQPASQKVPRTPGQVPERQGRRLESILVYHRYAHLSPGDETAHGGVCGLGVWDILSWISFFFFFFFFFSWLLLGWLGNPGV